MDLLSSAVIVDKNGKRCDIKDILKDKVGVALYFSAHWCPPCRAFTPRLAQAYRDSRIQGAGKGIEVIFVSSDRSETEFYSYMKEAHGDWFGLVPGQAASQLISAQFSIRGIPALKVIGLDGSLISEDGRQEVMSLGSRSFQQWELLAPAPIDVSVVNLLLDNQPTVKNEACDILIRLFSNIIKDPGNIKYRQVKLTNPKIESKLLPAAGAFEVLFSAGFEEDDDKLLLPLATPTSKIEKFHDALLKIKDASQGSSSTSGSKPGASGGSGSETSESGGSGAPTQGRSSVQGGSASSSGPEGGSSSLPESGGSSSNTQGSSRLLMPDVLAREKDFHRKLVSGYQHMLTYEDPLAQAAALSVMPVQRFESAAKEKLERAKALDPSLSDLLYSDFKLIEFKEWFKTEFFKWVDAPKCSTCNGDTENKGMLVPTIQEQADGAGRVEGYVCKSCGAETRFPRYHSKPAKLLETRRGRCGEWANCFVLCCRALGFDTRHILDWTDHVWSEVWSPAEDRWLHVDPGEAVDKPLVYEAGWGKKLTYVIASSKDEVQDVTWRYSKDHAATKQRRNIVRPKWLIRSLLQLTEKAQETYTSERKTKLAQRRLADCLEMLTPRKAGEGEKVGRQTGSVAWRLARGELGEPSSTSFTFTPSAQDVEKTEFCLEFFINKNYYLLGDGARIEGWRSGILEADNVTRIVESDWNMVYLARQEGNLGKGSVTWKVNLPSGYTSGHVELLVNSTVFKTGRVIWQLCGESSCLLPQPGVNLQTDQLSGSSELKLTALMSGGEGDLAWQHTQLFRCSSSGEEDANPSLRLVVKLKPV